MTEQGESVSASRINLIWECTQAVMTIMIVAANIAAAFWPITGVAQSTLTNALFVVLGFYYGTRTTKK